jgi:hypothetical protein
MIRSIREFLTGLIIESKFRAELPVQLILKCLQARAIISGSADMPSSSQSVSSSENHESVPKSSEDSLHIVLVETGLDFPGELDSLLTGGVAARL